MSAQPSFEEFYERIVGQKLPDWLKPFYSAAREGRWVISPGIRLGRKRFGEVVEQYERLFGIKRVGLAAPESRPRPISIIVDDPIVGELR